MRVKICGITRPEDGVLAARLGADAVGLVFHAKSPRSVTVERARAIVAALPPFVTRVGLFVNAAPDAIEAVLCAVAPRCPPVPRRGARRRLPVLRAPLHQGHPHAPGRSTSAAPRRLIPTPARSCSTPYVEGIEGGTGQRFDWSRVPKDLAKPIILAGGLTPDNVAQALAVVNPYAVDVSGGVERDKGIKDEDKMRRFISGVWDVGRG